MRFNVVDTHAHLDSLQNIEAALSRAENSGVIAVVTMGSDYRSNIWAIEKSSRYQRENLKICPSIGLHPWGLDELESETNIRFIEDNISKVVALGEIGLDYWYKDVRKSQEKMELQRKIFRRLLELAKKNGKPVSIHSRGAWQDCVDISREIGIKKAVFHWFSGPTSTLKEILEHGYYVSATPAAAYSPEHRNIVMNTPLDNLLLETDSPVAYKGQISEPSHVLKTLAAVAELKGKEEVIAKKTTSNSKHLFGI